MKKEELRRLQETELNILIDFDTYCEKHNLKYYLIGGALLGAARYGGFIPWDDDIDVAMPREDYEKLQQTWEKDTPEDYFLQSGKTDPSFSRCILKIRKNSTHIAESSSQCVPMHDGIYIDIFPIDYLTSDTRVKIALRAKCIRSLMSLRAIKNGYKNGRFKIGKRLIKNLLVPIGNDYFDNKIEKMCKKENAGRRKFAILFLHNYSWRKQTHLSSVFGQGGSCYFEGREFSAPNDINCFLRTVFGEDYIKEPGREMQVLPHNYISISFED